MRGKIPCTAVAAKKPVGIGASVGREQIFDVHRTVALHVDRAVELKRRAFARRPECPRCR